MDVNDTGSSSSVPYPLDKYLSYTGIHIRTGIRYIHTSIFS